MDKNNFWLGGRLFNTPSRRLVAPMQRHVCKLGAPTQCKARKLGAMHVCANARHVCRLQETQRKARLQICPNTTQGEFAIWSSKRKTHPQRKRPHKGAVGKKTRWRMDKNKFWLGGRLFNMASPRLGIPTQRKVRPQDGRPNATQGTSARWVPQRKTDPQ
jgi:hypothetical protein